MTTSEAKELLLLYRPGTADVDDPAFAEAMRLCERDAELGRWFEQHCDTHNILRGKFRQPRFPEGFKEQILAERPRIENKSRSFAGLKRTGVSILALAAIALALFILRPETEDTGLSGFQHRMVGIALRSYGMDLHSDNSERIRSFLAERKAISDYVLPSGLQTLKPLGCVATTWQGKPVSMICYRSGKPLAPGQVSDLWLFVAEDSSVKGSPKTAIPEFSTVYRSTAATWTQDGKTYVLAVDGDQQLLRKFL